MLSPAWKPRAHPAPICCLKERPRLGVPFNSRRRVRRPGRDGQAEGVAGGQPGQNHGHGAQILLVAVI